MIGFSKFLYSGRMINIKYKNIFRDNEALIIYVNIKSGSRITWLILLMIGRFVKEVAGKRPNSG